MKSALDQFTLLTQDTETELQKFKESNDIHGHTVIGAVKIMIHTVTNQINELMKNEFGLEKSVSQYLPSIQCFKDLSTRFTDICDKISTCAQDQTKLDTHQRSSLQLLQKVCRDETNYTNKLLCLQRVKLIINLF